jgi:hypothetical protein
LHWTIITDIYHSNLNTNNKCRVKSSESDHGPALVCPRLPLRALKLQRTRRVASRVNSPHRLPLQIRNVSRGVPQKLITTTTATRRIFHLFPLLALYLQQARLPTRSLRIRPQTWSAWQAPLRLGPYALPGVLLSSRHVTCQVSRTSTYLREHSYQCHLFVSSVSRRGSSARLRAGSSTSMADSHVFERTGQLQSPVNTPSRGLSRLSLTTPPPTPELMPSSQHIQDVSKKSVSLYTQARALLRPQGYETEPLIGREQERSHILDFLSPFVSDKPCLDNVASLYVSGAPGTGKTALVNQILSSLPIVKDNASHVSVHVININCIALGAKDGLLGVWERCVDELGLSKEARRGSLTKNDWSQRFSKLFHGRKWFEMVFYLVRHMLTVSL